MVLQMDLLLFIATERLYRGRFENGNPKENGFLQTKNNEKTIKSY